MGYIGNHLPQGRLGCGQLPVGPVELGSPLFHQMLQVLIDPLHLASGQGVIP